MLATLERVPLKQTGSGPREPDPVSSPSEERIRVIDASGRIVMSVSLSELIGLGAEAQCSTSAREEALCRL